MLRRSYSSKSNQIFTSTALRFCSSSDSSASSSSSSFSSVNFSTCDLCDTHVNCKTEKAKDASKDIRIIPFFSSSSSSYKRFGGARKMFGQVETVKLRDEEPLDNSFVKKLAGTPGNGRVLVVDANARCERALLGDMIAANASKNKWAGFIINGCVRDVEVLRTLSNLGVWALGSVPLKTDKNDLGQVGVEVNLDARVSVKKGEFVYVDETGILISNDKLH